MSRHPPFQPAFEMGDGNGRTQIVAHGPAGVRLAVMIAAVLVTCCVSITPGAAAASQPRIMYDSQQSPAGLWTRNLDGSDPAPFQAQAYEATWSASGTKLAYLDAEIYSCAVNVADLYVENADQSGRTYLGQACWAQMSPDGQHVVFQPEAGVIDVIGTAPGSHAVQVLPLPSSGCNAYNSGDAYFACGNPELPSWRGNSTIVFLGGEYGGGLWTIPSTGGALTELAGTDGTDGYAWTGGIAGSFDGTTTAASGLVTTSGKPDYGLEGIYALTAGGDPTVVAVSTDTYLLPYTNSFEYPQWSFDGKLIVFEDVHLAQGGHPETTSVDTVPSGGGTPTLITGTDTTAAFPTFAPPGTPGTIAGTVTGANSAPLAGATITITPQGGGAAATATTDPTGSYSVQESPGSYTVTASGTPSGEQAGGHYSVGTCSGTPQAGACALAVTSDATSTASFSYGTKGQLSGTITFASGAKSPVANMTVTITGTTTDGAAENATVTTNASGQYTADLDPGTYSVAPDPKYTPAPTASAGCMASGATCQVDLNADRTANFTVACMPTLDFQTSMIATGCFAPVDASKGTWTSIGQFRMDGINFKSPDDQAHPVIFDDQQKTVDGDQVEMSLSAAGFDGQYLAFYVPGGLHLSFPYSATLHTWALSTPWATPSLLSVLNFGFLAADSGSTTTLFGFPAHAPAVEVDFTPGQTVLTMQVSFPPTTSAWLDPINGLWKSRRANGSVGVVYPTAVKMKVTANNAVGVSQLEGSFAPAGVLGIDTVGLSPNGTGTASPGPVTCRRVRHRRRA